MPTSHQKISKKKISNKGFTLLEIMIVLAIISGIIVLGAMNLKTPQQDVKTHIRDLLILSKRLNQQAQLDKKTYRLVFSFNKEEASYWVESSDKNTVEALNKDTFKEDDKEKSSHFKMASGFTKKPKKLPPGFFFKKLYLIEQNMFFEQDTAYIHFFPQGMADAAALQITNEGESLKWTLIVDPISGSSELVDGLYDAEQLRRN